MNSADPSDELGTDLPFEDLVRALRAGDEAAWTRAFKRLLPCVKACLHKKFGGVIAREENAGGEAIASAWRTLHRNLTEGRFEVNNWSDLAQLFIRIATNKCIDRRKKDRRLKTNCTARDESEGPDLLAELAAPGPLPVDEVIRAAAGHELRRAMDLTRRRLKRANPKYADIFRLRLDGTYDNAQIAQQLGCSESTVKRGWAFALKTLRSLLDESVVEDFRT